MKKIPRAILIFVALMSAVSCSDSSDPLYGYWTRYKKGKPARVVKFEKNGRFVDLRRPDEPYTFAVVRNRLIISDEKGEKRKFFIKTLTDSLFELSVIDETGKVDIDEYRKTRQSDFFLGKWKAKSENLAAARFESSGDLYLKYVKNDTIFEKKLTWALADSSLKLGEDLYFYSFSKDFSRLSLKNAKSGKTIELIR